MGARLRLGLFHHGHGSRCSTGPFAAIAWALVLVAASGTGLAAARQALHHELAVEGERVLLGGVEVDRIQRPGPSAPACPELPKLARALARWARSEPARANPRPLRLIVDEANSYRGLCSLLVTARRAGAPVAEVLFRRGATATLLGLGHAARSSLGLVLLIKTRGFSVSGAGGELPPLACGAEAAARACQARDYPHARLGALLDEIKRKFPSERSITIAAEDAVPTSVLVATLATVKGKPEPVKCSVASGCRFDTIALTSPELARAPARARSRSAPGP